MNKERISFLLDHIKFSWLAFALYSLASVLSVTLRLRGIGLHAKFFASALWLGAIITGVTALLLYFGFKGFAKILQSNTWSVIVLLLMIGAIRGAALYWEIDLFGFQNRISISASVLSSTFYTAIYFAGSSLVVELRNRRKSQFHEVFQSAANLRLDSQRMSSVEQMHNDYESSLSSVRTAISEHIPSGNEGEISQEHLNRVASEIRDQIEAVIRPLSHRLWINSLGEIKSISSLSIIRDALKELDFSYKFVFLYQFSVGLFGIGLAIGIKQGLFKTFFAVLGTLSCFGVLNYCRKSELSWKFSTPLFLILLGIIPVIYSELASFFIGFDVNWLAGAIIAPTLPLVVIVASLFTLVSKDRAFAIAAAQAVSLQQVDELTHSDVTVSPRALSGYLHNNLQSELLRVANKLSGRFDADQKNETSRTLTELSGILDRSLYDVKSLQLQGIERLKALPSAWEGFAAIHMTLSLGDNFSKNRESLLVGTVEELIANSIRYGQARTLNLDISSGETVIHISLEHDGSGKLREGDGLGSTWISSISQGGYRISKAKGITRIDLEI